MPGLRSRRQPEGWTRAGAGRRRTLQRAGRLTHRGGASSSEVGWVRIASELFGLVGFEGNGVFGTQLFGREWGGDEGGQKWSACVRLGSGKRCRIQDARVRGEGWRMEDGGWRRTEIVRECSGYVRDMFGKRGFVRDMFGFLENAGRSTLETRSAEYAHYEERLANALAPPDSDGSLGRHQALPVGNTLSRARCNKSGSWLTLSGSPNGGGTPENGCWQTEFNGKACL